MNTTDHVKKVVVKGMKKDKENEQIDNDKGKENA